MNGCETVGTSGLRHGYTELAAYHVDRLAPDVRDLLAEFFAGAPERRGLAYLTRYAIR